MSGRIALYEPLLWMGMFRCNFGPSPLARLICQDEDEGRGKVFILVTYSQQA
jgi:hypothetical protein